MAAAMRGQDDRSGEVVDLGRERKKNESRPRRPVFFFFFLFYNDSFIAKGHSLQAICQCGIGELA